MKLASIRAGDGYQVAVVHAEDQRVWLTEREDMVGVITAYEEIRERLTPNGAGFDLRSAQLSAPIPVPSRDVFCVGKNYRTHAREFARSGFDSAAQSTPDDIPVAPIIFSKTSRSVIGNGTAIRYPHGVSNKVDYEAELAVVIGKGGRSISRERAYEHIFGYTILNDVTARDLQGRHKQWFMGKSLDTFCPMGPWLVTADEVDPENLEVRCWVNDELRQKANTGELIFDIPTLIETLSAGLTLLPGDIIATGTPAGVGIGFDPPVYLHPGDRVTIEISGLGRLSNPVV
jgi:2-keto-4-pentenoate hydratase/2-oxohepta-3-ene-1,7-dioic acid hydratase in catechol pathway